MRHGIRLFGESRVQEAEGKYPAFLARHPEARLDMIGHIQTNKAKRALSLFSRLQSIDSIDLLAELDKRARAADIRCEILLELHTGEASKEGFRDEDSLYRALELLLSIPDRRLEPRGLMTMAPNTADDTIVRASFRALRAALEGARARFAEGLGDFEALSMGMSGDFEIAVEEGATMVRIGTGLFGERAP
jgi:pyridoxal phosphate enzyme (YggS family)